MPEKCAHLQYTVNTWVGAPLPRVAVSMWRGMEVISWHCWSDAEAQVVFSLSVFLGRVFFNNTPQVLYGNQHRQMKSIQIIRVWRNLTLHSLWSPYKLSKSTFLHNPLNGWSHPCCFCTFSFSVDFPSICFNTGPRGIQFCVRQVVLHTHLISGRHAGSEEFWILCVLTWAAFLHIPPRRFIGLMSNFLYMMSTWC